MVTNIQTIKKRWNKHDKINNTYCSGFVLDLLPFLPDLERGSNSILFLIR